MKFFRRLRCTSPADTSSQLSPDDAYLSCQCNSLNLCIDGATSNNAMDCRLRREMCVRLAATTLAVRNREADEVPVTKEDVNTLKNDWLTDNVRLFPPVFCIQHTDKKSQVIAFWEEYDNPPYLPPYS